MMPRFLCSFGFARDSDADGAPWVFARDQARFDEASETVEKEAAMIFRLPSTATGQQANSARADADGDKRRAIGRDQMKLDEAKITFPKG